MNPKAKAENLIEKFIPNTRIWNDEKGWEDCMESAKRCALITVDEIITVILAIRLQSVGVVQTPVLYRVLKAESKAISN